jgi:hypothetical protein
MVFEEYVCVVFQSSSVIFVVIHGPETIFLADGNGALLHGRYSTPPTRVHFSADKLPETKLTLEGVTLLHPAYQI